MRFLSVTLLIHILAMFGRPTDPPHSHGDQQHQDEEPSEDGSVFLGNTDEVGDGGWHRVVSPSIRCVEHSIMSALDRSVNLIETSEIEASVHRVIYSGGSSSTNYLASPEFPSALLLTHSYISSRTLGKVQHCFLAPLDLSDEFAHIDASGQ